VSVLLQKVTVQIRWKTSRK